MSVTRKEIYDRLEDCLKYPFRVGELAYDRATDQGKHPLTAADASKLSAEDLEGIIVFISELLAAGSNDVAAKDDAAMTACGQILSCREGREPVLTPSYHGEDCQGNGQHPGIECCCDNCDYYLICFPDWRELSK